MRAPRYDLYCGITRDPSTRSSLSDNFTRVDDYRGPTTTPEPIFRLSDLSSAEECPAALRFFAEFDGNGKMNGAGDHLIGEDIEGTTRDSCAAECEQIPSCEAFMWHYESGACKLLDVNSDTNGVKVRPFNKWKVFDRIASRCEDESCSCAEFAVVGLDSSSGEVDPCGTDGLLLADQFGEEQPNTVLKRRWLYTLRKGRAADVIECQRQCVGFGDSCLAVEFSERLGSCLLKSARVGFDGYRGDIHPKPNGRYSMYNRHTICHEQAPPGVCISSNPLENFQDVLTRTKIAGPKDTVLANSVEDCAARCLAVPNNGCVASWRGCALQSTEPTNFKNGGNKHSVYKNRAATCIP